MTYLSPPHAAHALADRHAEEARAGQRADSWSPRFSRYEYFRGAKESGGAKVERYIKLFLGVHFADNLARGHRGISGVKWRGPKVLEKSP